MAQHFFKNVTILLILLTLPGCNFLGIRFGGNIENGSIKKSNIGGVFKSVDKASNFKEKNLILENKNINKINVKKLEFDPQDTLTLYLLSKFRGLWVTYNGAASWEQLVDANFEDITLDAKQRGVLYAAKESSILKTIDGGSTWKTVFSEPNLTAIKAISINPMDSNKIFAATKSGTVFQSTDAGGTWTLLKKKLRTSTIKQIIINPINPAEMYITTTLDGVLKSVNAGEDWFLLASLKQYKDSKQLGQFKINKFKPDHLYHASKYGLLKSTDAGGTWEPVPLLTPAGSTKILAVGFDPFNEKELYYSDKNAIYKSDNNGLTWTALKILTKKIGTAILVDDFDTNIVYIGVASE